MKDLVRQSVGETIEIQPKLRDQWWTICDSNQMENVILNLAINARCRAARRVANDRNSRCPGRDTF
jgi:hypothetical protein